MDERTPHIEIEIKGRPEVVRVPHEWHGAYSPTALSARREETCHAG